MTAQRMLEDRLIRKDAVLSSNKEFLMHHEELLEHA